MLPYRRLGVADIAHSTWSEPMAQTGVADTLTDLTIKAAWALLVVLVGEPVNEPP